MIISLQSNPSKKYVVYAIYWGKSQNRFQRLHYVIELDDGVGGFTVISEDKSNVVDPSVDNYVIEKGSNGMDTLIHKAALPLDDLFYKLSEHGYPEKVEKLFQNMRDMGLEPYCGTTDECS